MKKSDLTADLPDRHSFAASGHFHALQRAQRNAGQEAMNRSGFCLYTFISISARHLLSWWLYSPGFFQFLRQPFISRDHSVTALRFFLSKRLSERRFDRFVQHLFSQPEQNGVLLPHVADQMLAIQVGRLDESGDGSRISVAILSNGQLQLGRQQAFDLVLTHQKFERTALLLNSVLAEGRE